MSPNTRRALGSMWWGPVATAVIFVLMWLAFEGCAMANPVDRDVTESCDRATVTLKVVNNHASDIRIILPDRTLHRAALGLSVSYYRVHRSRLTGLRPLYLEIARGGLQVGGPAPVEPVGHISCNSATLVIGPGLRQSILFGADVR